MDKNQGGGSGSEVFGQPDPDPYSCYKVIKKHITCLFVLEMIRILMIFIVVKLKNHERKYYEELLQFYSDRDPFFIWGRIRFRFTLNWILGSDK